MSKKLMLYRHGKSDWAANYSSDHDRPLAEKGRNCAAVMGRLLASSGQLPDLVIVSSALRARQTLEVSMATGNWECEVFEDGSLYHDGLETIIDLIKKLPENASKVMLIGHEPKWSELTSILVGGGEYTFPTAAMARIDFSCEKWLGVEHATGELRWLLQPSFFTKGSLSI